MAASRAIRCRGAISACCQASPDLTSSPATKALPNLLANAVFPLCLLTEEWPSLFPERCLQNTHLVPLTKERHYEHFDSGASSHRRRNYSCRVRSEAEDVIPGPIAQKIVADDDRLISPSYTRSYPLVVKRARGLRIEDVDGNEFLDFTAGIAVNSTGHCHPEVVKAIQEQAGELLHMSGTDFYYEHMVRSRRG